MTTTTTDLPTFDPVTDTAAWRGVLRKVGLVYLFSRLCVSIGAAIVAAELSADANIVTSDFPNSPFADPHYASKPIPGSAIRPMLDVLTSWDGIWYLRIVRFGYPHTVRPNITYGMSDARAAFFPAYPMLVRLVDRILPGGDTIAALFTNFVLGAAAILIAGLARAVRGARQRTHDGADGVVPRQLRAVVRLHRGVAHHPGGGLPVVPAQAPVVAGRGAGSHRHCHSPQWHRAGRGLRGCVVLRHPRATRVAFAHRSPALPVGLHRVHAVAGCPHR